MKKSLLLTGTLSLVLLFPTFVEARTKNVGSPRATRRSIVESVKRTGMYRESNAEQLNAEVPLSNTYVRSDLNLRIAYPTGWELQSPDQTEGNLMLAAAFLSPVSSAYGGFRQNVNLVIEDLPEPMSLSTYSEEGISKLGTLLQNVVLHRKSTTTLSSGAPAMDVVYSATVEGNRIRFEQIWYVIGNKAHVWTFADHPDVFEVHSRTFRRMISTLQWMN